MNQPIRWSEPTTDVDRIMGAVGAGRGVQVSFYPREGPGWMPAHQQDRRSVSQYIAKGCTFRIQVDWDGPAPYSIGSDRWNGLSKLIEEAGEVLQVAGKLLAVGGETNHWSGDLRQMLVDELGDLQAAIEYFVFMNPDIDSNAVGRRAGMKKSQFMAWNDEQIDREAVDDA